MYKTGLELQQKLDKIMDYDKCKSEQIKKIGLKKYCNQLFKKNKATQVFKFLDNETSLAEELKIISTLPTMPFLKAALKQF
jgi:hypothetical protein